MQGLPVGFRFSPTDEELIVDFLQKKLKGDRLASDFVFECDIYADKEPWMLFDKTLKEIYYVFTKLKKKSKSRMERKVGCGTWKGENSEVVVNDKGRPIGFKKLFTFVEEGGSSSSTNNGHWIMHEFSVGELDEYVLCRIRNKDLDTINTYYYEPELDAAWEHFQATQAMNQSDMSQRMNRRKLVPSEANQPQKKIKLAQQCNDNGMEIIASASKQSQYDETCSGLWDTIDELESIISSSTPSNLSGSNAYRIQGADSELIWQQQQQQPPLMDGSSLVNNADGTMVLSSDSNLWTIENLEKILSSEPFTTPQNESGLVDIVDSNMEVSSLNHETQLTSSTKPSALNLAETKVTTQGRMGVLMAPQVFISSPTLVVPASTSTLPSGSNAYTTLGEGAELVGDYQHPIVMNKNISSSPYCQNQCGLINNADNNLEVSMDSNLWTTMYRLEDITSLPEPSASPQNWANQLMFSTVWDHQLPSQMDENFWSSPYF